MLLDEAFEQAEPGETFVVPMAARKEANLRTHMERIITKAGHEPWPRLFQNLRASCETDWVEKYPSHVVAKWLGHSPKVAAQHFLMSPKHHFESVVTGGSAADTAVALPAPARERTGRPEDTVELPPAPTPEGEGADFGSSGCDAAGVRTGLHRVARNDRTRGSQSGCSGFFGSGGQL